MLPFITNYLLSLHNRRRRRAGLASGARAGVFATAARIWSEVAAARGLAGDDPDQPGLRFAGAIHGVGCELVLDDERLIFRTSLRVILPTEAATRMRLSPSETGWARTVRLLGRRIRSGDAEFDHCFTVAADSEDVALAVLDATTRAALMSVRERAPHVRWEQREILVEMDGAELGHDVLLDLIDAFVRAPGAPLTPYR